MIYKIDIYAQQERVQMRKIILKSLGYSILQFIGENSPTQNETDSSKINQASQHLVFINFTPTFDLIFVTNTN
jgi:hypothetical protein